jgi:hypothetical protein
MRAILGVVSAWTLLGVLANGQPPALSLDQLVSRTAAYLVEYEQSLASVVAEERYDQLVQYYAGTYGGARVTASANQWQRRRRLVSDFLLVKVPGMPGWQPFRDVLEVDGQAVRDRESRLMDLLVNAAPHAIDQAARIAEESARYNIGNVSRTINVPTLPLVFLGQLNRPRFDLSLEGDRTIEDIETRGLAFKERQHPTLIRTTGDNDLDAAGVLWVEPVTGRVIQSVIRTDDGTLQSEITVTYRPDARLGIWVPARMKEIYKSASERVEGTATYAKYRRFKIETIEVIK